MSPCDIPVWYLRLTFSQALARYSAGAVSGEYWRCYRKAWELKHGRLPRLNRSRGREYVSSDLAQPVLARQETALPRPVA